MPGIKPPISRRLFIGGPLDGQWKTVTESVLFVPKPQELDMMTYLAPKPGDLEVPLPERVEYIHDMVNLGTGYRLNVMLAYRELDMARVSRTEAILKAILQRDVIQALGIK